MFRVAHNDAERNNIAFKTLDAVRQYALKFFKTAESGVDKVGSSCEKNPSVHWRYMNFLRQRKTALDAPLYAVSAGRSMIEMLGVLAIVGVLTVGGIAGYSKAMEKFKLNKIVDEYNNITFALIENYQSILSAANAKNNGDIQLYDIVKNLNIFPESWKPYYKKQRIYLDDGNNNLANYFVRYNSSQKLTAIYLDLHLGSNVNNHAQRGTQFPVKTCVTLFTDWLQPTSNFIYSAGIYSTNWSTANSSMLKGKSSCKAGDKCLATATLNDFHKLCNMCQKDKVECYLSIQFEKY